MKRALRILIALAVATMFVGGGLAGTVAAQDEDEIEQEIDQDVDQGISDDDLVDAQVNSGNPTTATAVNAVNIGSGSQSATALAESSNSAGDDFGQNANLDAVQDAELDD